MNRERTAMLEDLMEQAVSPENWEAALYAVERNRGAAGPDGLGDAHALAHFVLQLWCFAFWRILAIALCRQESFYFFA